METKLIDIMLQKDGKPAKIPEEAEQNPTILKMLKDYLLRRRQALLMELGQIEDILGMERSVPRRER